ncbi:unnamed protein product [Miscanthus lutarioriparius]|uniref:Uncharacterized protein n=1 Tax=Miscanthus lutarioriparius TaxID=422564 RepID=A0A811QIV4_9POAL|nr:unnamed protein product [Miscanthus lutarioriparius]
MAEAIIGPLVVKLQELAVSEARALVAVNDDIRSLRDKLMWMQAFLRDADPRRRIVPDEASRVWLHQTRDAAFDAEDAVDQYFLLVDLSSQYTISLKVPKLDTHHYKVHYEFSTQLRVRHNLSSKIKAINSRLENIIKNKETYKQIEDTNKIVVPWRASTAISVAPTKLDNLLQPPLVSREDKRKDLTSALLYDTVVDSSLPDSTPRQKVISVLGPSGVGKSSLVRDVYETLEIKNHFVEQALATFPPYSSASDILKLILRDLKEEDFTLSKREVTKELDKKLKGKRYLVVIDGEGLPLAIVLLSGLLRTKEYPVEWKAVFEHLKSKQSKRLDSILSLCFDDLPYDIKSCFLYFAALPTNMLIEAQDLVCMWMAEGFLRPKEGLTMEKVGYRYLKELIARHLINLEPMDENTPEEELVTIQSKVHAFLQIEAQEVNFVEIHNSDDIPPLSAARRLSLQNRMEKYAALANPMPKLRSILSNFEKEETSKEYDVADEDQEAKVQQSPICLHCSPHGTTTKCKEGDAKSYLRQLLQTSKFLRVINLQGLEVGDKLPNEIGDVVHLQYLAVTSCSLKEIPPSVGRLSSLQTLDVRDTEVKELPVPFWEIGTLRHVFGHRLTLPKQVGDLKNLQTLDTVKPDDNIPSAVFSTKTSLRRLEVMELDGMLIDMPCVEDMDIKSCLPNLLLLSLENTMVSQDFINKLAELPFLASLTLDGGSYKDEQLVFSAGGFHSLRRLTVDLEELKKLEIHESALPKLADLDILIHSNDLNIVILGKNDVVEKLLHEDKILSKKIQRTTRSERTARRIGVE